jgi:hypothetical protein
MISCHGEIGFVFQNQPLRARRKSFKSSRSLRFNNGGEPQLHSTDIDPGNQTDRTTYIQMIKKLLKGKGKIK